MWFFRNKNSNFYDFEFDLETKMTVNDCENDTTKNM